MDNITMTQEKSSPELDLKAYSLTSMEHGYPRSDRPILIQQAAPKKSPRCACWVIVVTCLSALLIAGLVIFAVLYAQGWICVTTTAAEEKVGATNLGNMGNMDNKDVRNMATPYSFEDIFDPDLIPRGFSADFVGSGSTMVYRNNDGALVEYDPTTQQETIIMGNSTFLALDTGTYFVSWDLQWVLLAYERQNIWRYSYNAKYKIYERSTGNLINFPNHPTLQNQTLQLARLADKTNQFSFVYGNNIYYQASPFALAEQVTTDGDALYVFNGLSDYLYEEDVLGKSEANYFSSGGRYLLWARLDDTGVPSVYFSRYGDKTTMYPETVEYAYPKPGDMRNGELGPNTQVQMHMVDTSDLQLPHWVITPPSELGDDPYYTRVAWRDDTTVLIWFANRVQNRSIVMLCDATAQTCVKNHDLEVAGGYLDVAPPSVQFVDSGNSYVTILPEDLGAQGSWLHLTQVTLNPTGLGTVTYLSTGAQETRFIVGFDSSTENIYYLDTNGDPTERHLFRVGSTAAPSTPECLTCAVGPGCLYVSAEVSTDGKYYIRTCRGPDIPTYTLIGVDDGLNQVLENNTDVQARLDQKLLPTREFIDFDLGDGVMGKAEVYYPPGYQANQTYRYLQDVYGGPNSRDVTKSYPIGGGTSNWLTFMKSTHNVVVTSVDGRGTHSNGQEHKFLMYKKLGSVEIKDQVAGANYFKGQPYVDPTKGAAIFGWSYGGFATAHSVAYDNHTFLCGLAVAPVTHYHYYDTAYTERYQGLATENPSGYADSDIMAKAANFKNKIFMMNHGSADDNVQLQHFMQLSDALIAEEVQFRQGVYVDENHGIGGSSRHLYQSFTNFLLNDCWG